MGRRVLTIIVGIALASVLSGMSFSGEFNAESWPTVSLGWRTNGGAVFSTENGGRTWHRILPRPIEVLNLARTSRTAGAIGNFRRRYWTIDNGLHWHATTKMSSEFDARGRWFFYIGGQRRNALYQVSPWPPRRGIIRQHLLSTASIGSFAQIAAVPGGVVAVIDIGQRPPYRPKVLIRRNGKTSLTQLPLPEGRPFGTCNVIGLTVEWPSINVIGQPRDTDGRSCNADIQAAMSWWSIDGGKTWWIAGGS
jgi:hypothetical protein